MHNRCLKCVAKVSVATDANAVFVDNIVVDVLAAAVAAAAADTKSDTDADA